MIAARRQSALAAGLMLLFFAGYLCAGIWLFGDAAWRNDELFEIDAARVADWMTRADALHLRTRVHPLYVLLVQPLGGALGGIGLSALWSVQLLTAAFAAGAVTVSFVAVLRWKQDVWLAIGMAGLFGVSASQLLLGTVPDTTGLATLVLAAATALHLRDAERGRPSYLTWGSVGILALGVTSTNLLAPLCLFGALCARLDSELAPGARTRRALLRTAALAGAVIALAAGMALLQQALYSNTKLFFRPELVQHEVAKFASLFVLEDPLRVIGEVTRHFLLASVVAPLPHEITIHSRPAVSFVGSLSFSWPGLGAALAWVGLGLWSGLRLRRVSSGERLFLAACALPVLAQLVMHCFYGVAERDKMEFFLYTGNAAWLVIVLGCSGLEAGSRAQRVGLLALVGLTAANNLEVASLVAFLVGRS